MGAFTKTNPLNQAAKIALSALLVEPYLFASADAVLAPLVAENCRANWLRGFVAEALGLELIRNLAWETVIRCFPNLIPVLYVIAPENSVLAEMAVREQPENAEAYFWLARIYTKNIPDESINLYKQGLQLKPYDGFSWLELGDLLRERDPQAAIHAYLESCHNGDPGSNGCWRAGLTAESQGDLEAAIRYYRLSRNSGYQGRADLLEQQLHLTQDP